MSQLTDVILKAGLISPDNVRELRRWGLPVGEVTPSGEFDAKMTPRALLDAISSIIESEGYVLTRETDLGAISQYLRTQRPAVLHVVFDEDGQAPVDFEVTVGQEVTGEWLLPWQSESITDLLTNGKTYLKIQGQRIFFGQARDLFYGKHRAFLLCVPSTVESGDGHPG